VCFSQNGEAIEGLVTKTLYDRLFSIYPEENDRKMLYLFESLDFVELKHLEYYNEEFIL